MDGLTVLAQFGFSAVAFYLVWMAYRELQPRLMDIISQNAEALIRVAGAMEQVVKGQDEAAIRLGRIDDRLMLLEEQHKRGANECPFMGGEDSGDADRIRRGSGHSANHRSG